MNPFQRHRIAHLSPSSLNSFIQHPGIWAAKYLGQARDAGHPKMTRGNAVERGFVAYLRAGKLDQAQEVATKFFWDEIAERGFEGPAVEKQAELIEPMLGQCLLWSPPSQLNASQIEIEYWWPEVPVKIKGYVDLAFDGVDIDLKTKEKLMSPSASEIRQVSLYRAARQRAGGLLIVTDKKHAYHPVTDDMMLEHLGQFRDAAIRITKLLAAFENAEDILSILPVDYDNFRAPPKGARPTASASDQFDAVQLES